MSRLHPAGALIGACLLLLVASCTDDLDLTLDSGGGRDPIAGLPVSPLIVPTPILVCGPRILTPLLAEQGNQIGSVAIEQDGATLYLSYEVPVPGPGIVGTAAAVAPTLEGIPVTRAGNPQLGAFPYRSSHDGPSQVTWAIPLPAGTASPLVVAAYAAVGKLKLGAWAAGQRFTPSGHWATYFTHLPVECTVEAIGPDGGALATGTDGNGEPLVELVIPEGALDDAVVITIEPASLADLDDPSNASIVAAPADAERAERILGAANLEGITPIAGTVWELKPTGQKFKKPIELRLRYDRANIPAGVDEASLQLYLVSNNVLDGPFGAADVGRSRVVGTIDHFSYAFIGAGEPPVAAADLSVTSLALNPAGTVPTGAAVTLTATVANAGPDVAEGVVVRYAVSGDASTGTLPSGCSATASPPAGGVEVVCALADLAAGATGVPAPSVVVTLPTEGVYDASATIDSDTQDPDASNNAQAAQVTAAAATPEADLQVLGLTDTPDPVEAAGLVTYEVEVQAADASVPVDGAVVEVRFSVEAQLVSSTPGCAAVSGGFDCALATLVSDVPATVTLGVVFSEADVTVDVTAEVVGPAGVVDPTPANNTAAGTTTILAAPSAGWVEEGTLPAAGDTVRYTIQVSAGQVIRIHTSLLANVTGSARMSFATLGGDQVFPDPRFTTAEGWSTSSTSANEVLQLTGEGQYVLKIASAAAGAPYRVGLGTDRGRADPAFGADASGIVRTTRGTDAANHFLQMAMAGNDIVTVGHRRLFRFTPDGLPDAGFGSNGMVDLPATIGGSGMAIAAQPDGKVLVAAMGTLSPYPWVVARFESDGSLDPSFGTNGIVSLSGFWTTSSSSRPVAIALQPVAGGTRILVSGRTGGVGGAPPIGLIGLTASGALDATFGTNGVALGSGPVPLAMGLQSDGRILLLSVFGLQRYDATGVLDNGFGTGGAVTWATLDAALNLAAAAGLKVLSDDRLLILGGYQEEAWAMRLTSGGQLDASFAGTGWITPNFGLRDRFRAAAEDGSDHLIIVGVQYPANNTSIEFLVTRFQMNGELDLAFGHQGYLLDHRLHSALAVQMDAQGRILVGGESPAQQTSWGVELLRLLKY